MQSSGDDPARTALTCPDCGAEVRWADVGGQLRPLEPVEMSGGHYDGELRPLVSVWRDHRRACLGQREREVRAESER